MIVHDIRKMLTLFSAVHRSVLVLYISKLHNISEAGADKAIYKALLARSCYEKNNFILLKSFSDVNSHTEHMSKALRIALEFMKIGDTEFLELRVLKGSDINTLLLLQCPPTEEELVKNNNAHTKLIQINYIPPRSELAASQMLALQPVAVEMRKVLQRIAIVEHDFNIENVAKAGYSMFVKFEENSFDFTEENIIKVPKEGRWKDVKEQ